MDLTTDYMGLHLRNPLVASASPLSRELDRVRELEDAGIGAVVMFSLFEEEIRHESLQLHHYLEHGTQSFAEALDYFPDHEDYEIGPDGYLEHLRQLKNAVDIPIIGSLNGTSIGGWMEYARNIEEAGADALELNIYYIPTEITTTSQDVEQLYLDILREVKRHINIPVAVKLSPHFSAMAHMAQQLDWNGADALVLFNRFYQPDIDLEALRVFPHVLLSTPQELRLPLRWIAILYGQISADLAATSGVHTAEDVLKVLMVGAKVAMMASVLLKQGTGYPKQLLHQMQTWMETHEYESVRQLQGSMSQRHCANPTAFERANYLKALTTYV